MKTRFTPNNTLGEIFTPIGLVSEMLDKIPEYIWTDKTKTFLDPCFGSGAFLVEIVRRLVYIYDHTFNEAFSRVYGYEIRVKYVNELKKKGFVNVYNKDFLKTDIDMKFDVVIGNPPYQNSEKPGDNALYQHFTKKVLNNLLKEGAYFSFVLPTTMLDYLLLCEKNRTYIDKFYNIESMVFDYPEEYFRKMGVSTTAFYFTIKNEVIDDIKQNIQITYKNNDKKKIINRVVYKGEVLPKKNFQEYDSIASTFLSKNSFEFKVMKTKSGKNRRIRKKQIEDGIVTTQPTDKNIYPIIDKITKNEGKKVYYFNEQMVDYESSKVIFCKSGYPMATYVDYPVNLSDNMMYINIENEIQGKNLAFIINSQIFSKVINLFSTNARDAHKIICKLKKVILPTYLLREEKEINDLYGRDFK